MARFSYGAWAGGPDPLAGPLDVRSAVDALGRDVMEGRSVREALRDLLRRGEDGRTGLRDLAARAARRQKELRRSGDLAGPLQRAREQLAEALAAEREALAMDDDDAAREREQRLDDLPRDTAEAVRELEDDEWRSPAAEAMYRQVREQLRDDVLGAQFAGLRDALAAAREARRAAEQGGDAEGARAQAAQAMQQMKDMLADLNALLAAHARGEDTTEQFEQFMARHGEAFGDDPPGDVEELVDELARRQAAMDRMLSSLSPQQRAELSDLMADALGDAGLEAEMAALSDALRALRPGLDRRSRERFTGGDPMSVGEGTDALAELSDLDALSQALGQDYPGASLDDVDVEAVERQLGAGAAADVRALQQLDGELRRQGWLSPDGADALSLTPKALRRLGESALAAVFSSMRGGRRGGHDERSAGAAGEATGSWRDWQFGDEQPLDAVRTVQRAVLRTAGSGAAPGGTVTLEVEDFAVVETERRTGAAVALCVDLSFSMVAEDRWAPMKQTALALSHLIATRFPADQLEIIGFGRTAEVLSAGELAAVEPSGMQGTNLQHALALARRHVARHPGLEPVVLVVTDGEPTAHLEGGEAVFWWPTLPETVEATVHEVDALTRMRTPINTFVLGDDPGLRRFVDALARRNGGRVLAPSTDRLGEYVVSDYLSSRTAGRV
ncbi:VWA domain-containing protein [Pseudokineococcus sp. 1T1Z-3]|uniref:VWA domain-containing protein n=1 Tax=Pseudokineococcus sp. 1T1Z-3 TaxID=3132745 RepID=UPI0030A99C43